MLILLPPSETKTQPADGDPVDLGALSFPELTEARETLLTRLEEVSAREDAGQLLKVGPSLAAEVERNRHLRELPVAPALQVYTGVLYDALDAASLTPAARERAGRDVVIASALWGAIAATDRIPAYRLSMGAKIAPKGSLAAWWKGELSPVLEARAADELIIDCRSGGYQAAWPAPAEQTVLIRAERESPDGTRKVVSHMAKHYRGLITRSLLLSGQDPTDAEALADLLAREHRVELSRDTRGTAQLSVIVPAAG